MKRVWWIAFLFVANQTWAAAPYPGDSARNLVDALVVHDLWAMRRDGLEKARLSVEPWSGWYWPLKEGGLASRYADSAFPADAPWDVIFHYLSTTLGRHPVSQLSPAEKYDLLLGDSDFSLTKAMIAAATRQARTGAIEIWIGYCTGWANAAMMLPRPRRSVVVMAADGRTEIEFLPSDIKALGTLLWATGVFPSRIAGSLCQEDPVQREPVTERPIRPECQDTNPATFHLTVVNQIGVEGRSFLIDSDPGYQIWNQPVSSYSYEYFNPATGRPASLEDARIDVADFKNDPFARYRAAGTRTIVGISLALTFVYETRPTVAPIDLPEWDEKRVPTYRYDLELDKNGKIIGGEWHSRLHPDLLWLAERNAYPVTVGDRYLESDRSQWNSRKPLPSSWISAARAAEKYQQPLGRIVRQLFSWASQ